MKMDKNNLLIMQPRNAYHPRKKIFLFKFHSSFYLVGMKIRSLFKEWLSLKFDF